MNSIYLLFFGLTVLSVIAATIWITKKLREAREKLEQFVSDEYRRASEKQNEDLTRMQSRFEEHAVTLQRSHDQMYLKLVARREGLTNDAGLAAAIRWEDGRAVFDETPLVDKIRSVAASVMDVLPSGKMFFSLKDLSVTDGIRHESKQVDISCRVDFMTTDGSVFNKEVIWAILNLDVLKCIDKFLKARSADKAARRVTKILQLSQATLAFLEDRDTATIRAAYITFDNYKQTIIVSGYTATEQSEWRILTQTFLFQLEVIIRHALIRLETSSCDLPESRFISILPDDALKLIESLKDRVMGFGEAAYTAHAAIATLLFGLRVLSLLDVVPERVSVDVLTQAESCKKIGDRAKIFTRKLQKLVSPEQLNSIFRRRKVDESRQVFVQLVTDMRKQIDEGLNDLVKAAESLDSMNEGISLSVGEEASAV